MFLVNNSPTHWADQKTVLHGTLTPAYMQGTKLLKRAVVHPLWQSARESFPAATLPKMYTLEG